MVEPSGCRCACQEEAVEQPCCSPHVFTSILLGILSCVLMTGGVFLAFHKWDPMWLLVSGIGVVLIIVGTVLHCCHALASRRTTRRASGAPGKGGCPRSAPVDHPGGHLVMNNGSLTEQLLPLSNARSVSQLSLNMLPGYFPPVMTAYGIEQHSAVVQNINRLVQQQQTQPPQSNGASSPGVISNAGKSFIVLSLPSDASAANIQNLVATVYQLDGSPVETPTDVPSSPPPIAIIKPNQVPSVLKNAEVQTCSAWPAVSATAVGITSTSTASSALQTQPSTVNCALQLQTVSTSTGETQTDDSIQATACLNLMDCSVDVSDPRLPDHNCISSAFNSNSASTSPEPLPSLLEPSTSAAANTTSMLVELPDSPPPTFEPATATSILIDVNDDPSNNIYDVPSNIRINATSHIGSDAPLSNSNDAPSSISNSVLVDVSEPLSVGGSTSQCPILEDLMNTVIQQVDNTNLGSPCIPSEVALDEQPTDMVDLNLAVPASGPSMDHQGSNVSINDDIDEGELMERSSPPPSYDDVATVEGEAIGAFGLAYGTI